MTPTPETPDLHARLARLERRCRALEGIVAAVLLGAAAALVACGTVSGGKSLEAQRVALTDGSGAVRALLGAWPDGGTSLRFLDKDGKKRAELGVGGDGAARVAFFSPDEKQRVALGVNPDQTGNLLLYGANGRPGAVLV